MQQHINSILSTINLAYKVSRIITQDSVVALHGEVGSGKSTFVGHLLKIYGFEYIGSPTFTTLNEYISFENKIIHMDLYNKPRNVLEELFNYDRSIKIIEWFNEDLRKILKPDIEIIFHFDNKYRYCEVIKK